MGTMFRTVCISSSLLLFAALFYIFSPTIFGLYFLLAVITLLGLLLLSVHSAKKHTKYTIEVPQVMTKGEAFLCKLRWSNSSKLFSSTVSIMITWEHIFTKQRYTEWLSLTIPARKTVTTTIQPAQLYNGQYNIHTEKIVVTDSLALFSLKKQAAAMQVITVLPNTYVQTYSQINKKNTAQLPNATTFTQLNGDELAHLKLYQPGDSVKQIHWKLSSKLDELYIKQLETTTGQQFVLAVDATKIDDNIELYDRLIEETANQLLSAVLNGRSGQLAFYENGWFFDDVTNELQGKVAIQKLLVQTTLCVSADAWQQLIQHYPHALLLTTNNAHTNPNTRVVQIQGREALTDELDT